MKPYYEEAGITIYHGDCREVLAAVETGADAMLTDPPWGVNKAAWDERFVLPPVPDTIAALGLMPGVWNIARCPERLGQLDYQWTLSAYLCNGLARGAIGFGNWIPCMFYARESRVLFAKDGDARRFVVGRDAKPNHPSPKPRSPVEWFLSRLPGTVVVDPFMGSGTTLVAAKNLGRRAVGIEFDERAAERLAQGVLDFGGVA